ncbi:bifunctional UDP-3-O-[3-hydroxymyristoyl] N-acetylglucosamine deacetylase/3-hydroxyacyl-ACP dehydratase [bacterium]|nr:bifunctional UDP-3-O-[3-hydroxymyristoyl] N-acetylglucosamine deacetylase/3-hydroxyacyl-ACP dehydratase [bacterium]
MLVNQRTIKTSGRISGIGLHTGNKCRLTFEPAPVGYGFKFVRTDLEGSPEIPALIGNVGDIARGTTLLMNGAKVVTVEHVLSALAGLQLDNVKVKLDAEEAPVMDGSAQPFVDLLQSLGFIDQGQPKQYFEIDRTITYHDEEGGVDLVVVPSDRFRVTYMIDYKNPALGTQYTSLYDIEEEFARDFASARTFCFLSELLMLHKAGLIKGGRVENALVIIDREYSRLEIDEIKQTLRVKEDIKVSKSGILGEKHVRYPNEPVRHKVVDLIGDLALLGIPIKGHVLAARAGHAAHVELVKKLKKQVEKKQLQRKYQVSSADKCVFDINAIKKILPHRYPFLLVDRIIEFVPGEWVTGIKNVSVNEPFFEGHFPEHPIMPGVLVIEAMGQTGGILLLNTTANPDEKLVFFTGMDNVKFRKPVMPGDQLQMRVEMVYNRRGICKMKGRAFVDGQLAAEADMQAVIVDRDSK